MKKMRIVIFCLLSLFVLALAGNAIAYNEAYTHTDYMTATAPTINGQYAMGDEWVASKSETFGTNGIWRDEWIFSTSVFENILVETSDATDDAGDYFEICFDGTPNSGTAPQTDDFRVVITGHGAGATIQWYVGTGTAWATTTSSATWAQSLSTSPRISAPHYILEMQIDKQGTAPALGQQFAMRIAYNDAHAGGNGLQEWPPAPATRDSPAGWGYIIYEMAANQVPDVPENLGIVAVLALSSVAIVGAVLLRKRQK